MGASGQLSHVVGSLRCLKTKSVPVLDIPRDEQLGPGAACHRVSRHLDSLFCLGPLEKVVTGQREGRPFTITPPLAPPQSCLAFIWQNGAYQNHQLNKHTNPRLVRKNTLPELFISCSQALHTAHCQKHRRGPEAVQWGPSSPLWRWRVAYPSGLALSAFSPQPSPFLPPCPQLIDTLLWEPLPVGELRPTQKPPPVSAFSLGTMGQLVACGTVEGQG